MVCVCVCVCVCMCVCVCERERENVCMCLGFMSATISCLGFMSATCTSMLVIPVTDCLSGCVAKAGTVPVAVRLKLAKTQSEETWWLQGNQQHVCNSDFCVCSYSQGPSRNKAEVMKFLNVTISKQLLLCCCLETLMHVLEAVRQVCVESMALEHAMKLVRVLEFFLPSITINVMNT